MNGKFFWGLCMLTASVVVSSCSSDDAINSEDNNVSASKQTITLAVANTGDNFATTRAGRPLYSSAAAQDIEKVKVVIYKLGDKAPDNVTKNDELAEKLTDDLSPYGEKAIVAQKVFSPWMKNGVSNAYSDGTNGNGRVASWTLASTDQITSEGVYMAYAVGYNDGEYSALTAESGFGSLAKSTTETEVKFSFPLTVAQNTKGDKEVAPKVYEIFAGSAPFLVTKKTANTENTKDSKDTYEFNVSLTLHRQVAGTIGYFTNIPVKGNAEHADADGAKLRLVASYRSDNMVFAAFNSAYTGGTGTSTDQNTVKYVVNGYDDATTKKQAADAMFYGSSTNDAYTVYEVELAKWFTNTKSMDSNGDGLLNKDDDWTNPLDSKNTYPNVKKGTVLGSSFLFPFAMVADKPTLQLQMLDEKGEIIRYWNIRLQSSSSTDSQVGKQATKVAADGTTTTGTDEATKENSINYSILRNHLYNIGARDNGDGSGGSGGDGGGESGGDGSGDGGDGDSGGGSGSGGSDDAQDLNNENLILRVNDKWEMIHRLDID